LEDSEQNAFEFYNNHKECISSDEYETIKTKTLVKRNRIEFQTSKREIRLKV